MKDIDEYSWRELELLFDLEVGDVPEEEMLVEFRRFVRSRKFSKKNWPYSYHMWLVERVHEFSRFTR